MVKALIASLRIGGAASPMYRGIGPSLNGYDRISVAAPARAGAAVAVAVTGAAVAVTEAAVVATVTGTAVAVTKAAVSASVTEAAVVATGVVQVAAYSGC